MKLVLDDGTEIPIIGSAEMFQKLLDATGALIETNEKWIAARERETEAIRKHVFTLRRCYDAIDAVKDATERNEKLTREVQEMNEKLAKGDN